MNHLLACLTGICWALLLWCLVCEPGNGMAIASGSGAGLLACYLLADD